MKNQSPTDRSVNYLSVFMFFLLCYSFPAQAQTVEPLFITEPVANDSDDPAVWINSANPEESLIIGTNKDNNGALYVFTSEGEIVDDKVAGSIDKPNNVDVAYGLQLQGRAVDIAVTTERLTSKLRVFSLPDMEAVDGGGFPVFDGESGAYDEPMGIALYTRPSDGNIFAIVSRKDGYTNGTYLWQYLLEDDGQGNVKGTLVRQFGEFSGDKEIEAIAVDNELGYVYCSDEGVGVRKYYADPDRGNQQLAFFATTGFDRDHEGITIYKIEDGTGYIIVSDQGADEMHIFPREGTASNPHEHPLLKVVSIEADDTDGIEVVNYPIPPHFMKGLFVAMSDDKTFHLYRWEDIAGDDLRVEPPGDETNIFEAPSKLTARGVSSSQIDLSWQDNTTDEDGFVLQRATNPNFTGSVANIKLPANATSYEDWYKKEGVTFYYRIKAVKGFVSSDYSNMVLAVASSKTSGTTARTAPVVAYPNTFTNYVALDFQKTEPLKYEVKVYDLQGRMFFEGAFNPVSMGEKIYRIDLSDPAINEGIYLIQIENREIFFRETIRIAKTR